MLWFRSGSRSRGGTSSDWTSGWDVAESDGAFGGSEDLTLVWRTGEDFVVAGSSDLLAPRLGYLAPVEDDVVDRVPAGLVLVPTVLDGLPASILIGVVWHFGTAPVGVLKNASLGLQAISLGLLSDPGVGVLNKAGHLASRGDIVVRVSAVVDVPGERRVRLLDVAWNGNSSVRNKVTSTLEEDLSTARVELWVTISGGVQGQQFRTKKVVTTLEARGELDGNETIVGDHVLSAPLVAVETLVPELEPSIAGGYYSCQ